MKSDLKTAAVCVSVALAALVAFSAYAFAGGLDPAGDPLGAGSLIWKLWKGGALVPAIIVASFAAAIFAGKYIPWLHEGKRAVHVAGALAALTILVEPATRGETPNLSMIVSAIGAYVALVTAPTKTGTATGAIEQKRDQDNTTTTRNLGG